MEFRTHRPVFQSVVLELQHAGRPMVLFVGDDSRIARNERDGLDLLDAARVSGAYVVAPDEEGGARWILTHGGTPAEVSAFKDRMSDARKSSDDLSAKLRRGRRRWAGKSYHGGIRPFGYRVKRGTEEYKRNLVLDEREAALIRKARDDLFSGSALKGTGLKGIGLKSSRAGLPRQRHPYRVRTARTRRGTARHGSAMETHPCPLGAPQRRHRRQAGA